MKKNLNYIKLKGKNVMKFLKLFTIMLVTIVAVILTGCSKPTPMGSDEQVKELVISIVKENTGVRSLKYAKIENIRTVEVNKDIKKSTSEADLHYSFSGSIDTKTPIKYTAQINENGELYVEVYGDLPRW
ncbi:hypothetical protein AAEX28_06830 [Lentisphaerota bacterium WC36G]|nr:hypothetical protein LJT99_09695 [Lentisphaerae bacterium WC36]UDQ97771.1 hypothetical protein LJT99_15145 [Lentisphaerae bacterium WC36]UDQ99432.1 hypothetical protein LJT99_07785 [Lentisphaerae bacterium WC36]